MLISSSQADKTLLDQAKNLKAISRIGMGYDNVVCVLSEEIFSCNAKAFFRQDLEHAGKLGIYVNNIPDYGVEEVADSALCHILKYAYPQPPLLPI